MWKTKLLIETYAVDTTLMFSERNKNPKRN